MIKKKNILELGCGEGYHANILSRNKANIVYGVDLSQSNINFAKMQYSGPAFFQMSAEMLNFPDDMFDELYALDVLEHVDDLEKTAKEITRVLKPTGKLIINVPAEKSEHWLLKIRPTYFEEIHHVRIFKGDEMQKLFERLGFIMHKKCTADFLSLIPLYYLFTTSGKSQTQLRIGDWNANWKTKIISIFFNYFRPDVLQSRYLKYFPIWIVTIPIGYGINFFGNRFLPKSMYYEFLKV